MKLTPLDIEQQEFSKAFRGYNKKEVSEFLKRIREEFEELIRENNSLKEEIKLKDKELESWRVKEKILNDTLITVQNISEDIKNNARKEGEIIISEAELKAEKLINEANKKLVQVMNEISELKKQKILLYSEVKSIIEAHIKLLDNFYEKPFSEEDEGELKLLKK